MARGEIVPRSIFDIPRLSSFFDEDEWLSFPQASNAMSNNVSISEDDKNVYVEAAVPGINPDDIEMTFDKGLLWIRGENKEEEGDKKKKYYRRAVQSFSYRIAVPGDVDLNVEPEASSANGVIKVVFAKSAQAQPKKISIKASGKSNGGKNK